MILRMKREEFAPNHNTTTKPTIIKSIPQSTINQPHSLTALKTLHNPSTHRISSRISTLVNIIRPLSPPHLYQFQSTCTANKTKEIDHNPDQIDHHVNIHPSIPNIISHLMIILSTNPPIIIMPRINYTHSCKIKPHTTKIRLIPNVGSPRKSPRGIICLVNLCCSHPPLLTWTEKSRMLATD